MSSGEDDLQIEEAGPSTIDAVPSSRSRGTTSNSMAGGGSMAGGTFLRSVSRLCGEITLDRSEARVGETVTVQWNIHPATDGDGNRLVEPSERDWIGLFNIRE